MFYRCCDVVWCSTLFRTPQNLFQQFLKVANFYFLVIAVLSFTPFSPKTPLVSIVPLVFVLSVTAVKEALEDYVSDGSCGVCGAMIACVDPLPCVYAVCVITRVQRRYRQDVVMNNTPVMAYRNREWVKITWADVLVGDILMVHAGHTSFFRAPHLPACLPAVCVVWIMHMVSSYHRIAVSHPSYWCLHRSRMVMPSLPI